MTNAHKMYEIKAEVFYKMTGFLAPGKDCPAAYAGYPRAAADLRQAAWDEWIKTFGECVEATWALAENEIDDIHLEYKEQASRYDE